MLYREIRPRSRGRTRRAGYRSIDANQRRIATIRAQLADRREGRAENRMLREELVGSVPTDRERRREIYQTLEANGRAIGEAKEEIARLKREG